MARILIRRGLRDPMTGFLARLKRPGSADVVKKIKSFVEATVRGRASSRATWARDDTGSTGDAASNGSGIIGAARSADAVRVRKFLKRLEDMLRVHPEWGAAPLPSSSRRLNGGTGPAGVRSFGDLTEREQREWMFERENSREGLEKILMSKIYAETFARQGDAARDDRLDSKCATLAKFIRGQHLDLPAETAAPEFADSWQRAGEELRNMSKYKAPREKMVCALQCCRLLSNLLTAALNERAGADEFLPALIYAVIRANPPNLFSNLRYIAAYRNPDKLVSEPGYFFTNLVSAMTFIEQLDASSLSIDADEFNREFSRHYDGSGRGTADPDEEGSDAVSNNDPRPSPADTGTALPLAPQKEAGAQTGGRATLAVRAFAPARRCAPVRFAVPMVFTDSRIRTEPSKQSGGVSRHRYRFLGRSASTLTLNEIPELLKEYEVLVAALLEEQRRGEDSGSAVK